LLDKKGFWLPKNSLSVIAEVYAIGLSATGRNNGGWNIRFCQSIKKPNLYYKSTRFRCSISVLTSLSINVIERNNLPFKRTVTPVNSTVGPTSRTLPTFVWHRHVKYGYQRLDCPELKKRPYPLNPPVKLLLYSNGPKTDNLSFA